VDPTAALFQPRSHTTTSPSSRRPEFPHGLGLGIDQETADETVRALRGLGLSRGKEERTAPGVPVLVAVVVAGHTLHLLPEMAMPALAFVAVRGVQCQRAWARRR